MTSASATPRSPSLRTSPRRTEGRSLLHYLDPSPPAQPERPQGDRVDGDSAGYERRGRGRRDGRRTRLSHGGEPYPRRLGVLLRATAAARRDGIADRRAEPPLGWPRDRHRACNRCARALAGPVGLASLSESFVPPAEPHAPCGRRRPGGVVRHRRAGRCAPTGPRRWAAARCRRYRCLRRGR